jgi:ubiquinone/menaquinone biosynthesis C-methylase UbiE
MDHFEKIYANNAGDYHRMIAVEDVDGNLLPALNAVTPIDERRVLDLGSGTGRLPLLLHHRVDRLVALDLNFPMLIEQAVQRDSIDWKWPLVNGDMRWLPFADRCFDIVIAGWAIGHLRSWFEADWKQQMGLIFDEMQRMTASGGAIIVLETMTTGSTKPMPPTEGLAEYYQWMENEWGFKRNVIRTDYQFDDIEQAVAYTEFFFGADLARAIRENDWVRLPEWTGVWGKSV